MASISELIKDKSTRDQAWVEGRKAERENLSAMRDAALEDITTDPVKYQKFLTLQSDNIACSVGNVALTMFQLDGSTRIGPVQFWHEQGRYVREDAMKSGAKVFVPPRNSQRRGYLMGDYYDISQTTGKPVKEQPKLTSDSSRMDAALAALMNYCPVEIMESSNAETPACYDDVNLTLTVNPNYEKAEVFAALTTEITYARIHDRGRNSSYDRSAYRLDAESVGYMICRRLGVDCQPPTAQYVAYLYDGYEPSERGEALEQIRKTARNMGDGIERAIQPRQQERSRRGYGSR